MAYKLPPIIIQITVTSLICSALIVLATIITKPAIQKNSQIDESKNLAELFGIEHENISKCINKKITPAGPIFEYKDNNGNLHSICIKFKGMGFWGEIEGLLALKPDFKTITGLKILKHQETPGLGSIIAEDEFLKNFSGKIIYPNIKITRSKKAETQNEVDAVSGATESSKALEKILNNNMDNFKKYL